MNVQQLRNLKKLIGISMKKASDYDKLIMTHWGRKTTMSINEITTRLNEVEIGTDMKSCSFTYNGRRVRLSGHHAINLANDIFGMNQYEFLKDEKVIIDVGANIGDTAIYFALNGAIRVYAFEPYPYSYEMMMKNVSESKVSNIEMIMEGVSNKKGTIRLTKEEVGGDIDLEESKKGIDVKITTLNEIAEKYNLNGAALKIDCNDDVGIISAASDETLLRFNKIEIETLHGDVIGKRFGSQWNVIYEKMARRKGETPNMHNSLWMLKIERKVKI